MKKIDGYDYYYITKNGEVYSTFTGQIKRLKTQFTNDGYEKIKLKKKTYRIHRLVAIYFIENPLNLPQVNHIDGNKLNNSVENLEWCDNSYNQKHAWNIGLQKAKTPSNAKLSLEQANEIRQRYVDEDISQRKLASIYGVAKTTIADILNGRYYNHKNEHGNLCRPKTERKLSIEQANEIRDEYKKHNCSYNSLGRKYGVNHKTIKKIIENKSYIN